MRVGLIQHRIDRLLQNGRRRIINGRNNAEEGLASKIGSGLALSVDLLRAKFMVYNPIRIGIGAGNQPSFGQKPLPVRPHYSRRILYYFSKSLAPPNPVGFASQIGELRTGSARGGNNANQFAK